MCIYSIIISNIEYSYVLSKLLSKYLMHIDSLNALNDFLK